MPAFCGERLVSRPEHIGEPDTTNWVYVNRRTVRHIPPVALVEPKLISPAQCTDPPLGDHLTLARPRL